MANSKRPPLLGTPRWDTENRAVAHLLFILFDLWPDHQDDLINIFHHMFPHFQRIRFTVYHLRDMWQQRFGIDRNAYNDIDRPNERDHRPSTQAQLNDFATLTSIIHRWATSLGITLRPRVPAMNHRYGGGTYDFSNAVADPNDVLTTYVNASTGARSALRPGDAIPQTLVDLMTVGVSTDRKLQFGMPVDGLPNLPMTIGFDVDDQGEWLSPQPQPAPQLPAAVPRSQPALPTQPSQKQLPVTNDNASRATPRSEPSSKRGAQTAIPTRSPPQPAQNKRVGVSPEDAHLLPHKQMEMYSKGQTMDGRQLRPMQSGNSSSVPVPFSPNYTR
ncbi:hypothetical protein AC578_933 [Pseudocercospora eumusae]|uniref:Uncharacterized protein n=1 Tax=Pseudocercospora eumusae TaxID=321146 RepID=A0A139HBT9_9PEZI|nr:hypothetical protein AC578_933 [Pseudocercospora eumusae]